MTRAARLHAGAWWLWALALAVAASRTTNAVLLGLVLAVAGAVVVTCREPTPWAGSYGVFVRLGLVVVAVRTLFHVLLGGVAGPTVLVRLPEAPLPSWAHGIRLGGPVTAEGLVFALADGLRLAVLLACVGAANSLANPRRMLRALPAALYEVSVAVVVALGAAPQLVESTRHARRARELRGDTARGRRVVRTVLVPVLEDALARSLTLAAAMDARGYGRAGEVPRRVRALTGALVLAGLAGSCLGAYGLLDTTAPRAAGWPALAAGAALAVAGLRLGARRVTRTRYRPDRWGPADLLVVLSGVAAPVAVFVAERSGTTALVPPVSPLAVPPLPLLPALGVLVALAPVVVR